jgi:ParB/RepB/Spo0J family partition protein
MTEFATEVGGLLGVPVSDLNWQAALERATVTDLGQALAELDGQPGTKTKRRRLQAELDFRRRLTHAIDEQLQGLHDLLAAKPGNVAHLAKLEAELARRTAVGVTADAGAQQAWLVRLTPEDPAWHLQLERQDRTVCGKVPGPEAPRTAWRGLTPLPTLTCTRCAPHLIVRADAAAEARSGGLAVVPEVPDRSGAPANTADDGGGGLVVQEVPVDRVEPARDNPRGKDPGDVDELAASIRQVGVLQPITATRRGKRLLVVYGHRRLKAARQAGLATIPAIVREMSEAERIARQTIENLHRQGLTPLQDATAIANLRDAVAAERGGTPPGQRELAELLGVSQSHVSKHLALLELPKPTRAAVDSGGITLQQAGELHKLVAVGRDQQAEQLTRQQLKGELRDFGGRSTLADRVAAGVKQATAQARAAEVRQELAAGGHRVLEEPEGGGWWSSPAARIAQGQPHGERHCLWTGAELTELTVAEHAAAHPEGHAAALCGEHGEAVWLCTDPTEHAEVEEKAAARAADRLASDDADKARREQERQLGRAAKVRQAFAAEQLAKPVRVHASDRGLLTEVVLLAAERQESEAAKLACRLLGLEPVIEQPSWAGGSPSKNYREAVRRHAEDPANLGRVARALPWSEGEFRARWSYSTWGRLVLRYLDQLVAAGYALSPVEQQRHQEATTALNQATEDQDRGDQAEDDSDQHPADAAEEP